ncbi:protein of unknown function [Belliella buryatensis]|uniref:DUF4221 domain-containing protein n=1 Tax=Belliella buryatensis TaxID=1500549 RepID=A0A239BBI7_9BACT|nr:DUF4221 family protein [Belliella buryatensis]SNS04962.1 protein of unknown function [Belliella buryatensis]
MKYSLLSFRLVLIGAVAFSCTQNSTDMTMSYQGELKAYIQDTLYLEKDLETKSLPQLFTYQKSGAAEFLLGFVGSSLLKYDYSSGVLVEKVTFEKEGPDGIGGFIAGNLITKDGIFFISDQKQIIQTDLSGKMIQKIPLPDLPSDRMAANFNAFSNLMHWNEANKRLIVTDVPFVLKEPLLPYKDWVWAFDFKEKSAKPILQFNFPKTYQDHLDDPELGVYFHTYDSSSDQHLIGFPVTDSLLVSKGGKQTWVYSGSRHPLIFQKGKTESRGEYTVFQPSNETSRYKSLMVDNYQKLILRHLIISQEVVEKQFNSKNSFILMNLDLEYLGELDFSTADFAPRGFATPSGFYLKLQNQESDDREAYVRLTF